MKTLILSAFVLLAHVVVPALLQDSTTSTTTEAPGSDNSTTTVSPGSDNSTAIASLGLDNSTTTASPGSDNTTAAAVLSVLSTANTSPTVICPSNINGTFSAPDPVDCNSYYTFSCPRPDNGTDEPVKKTCEANTFQNPSIVLVNGTESPCVKEKPANCPILSPTFSIAGLTAH